MEASRREGAADADREQIWLMRGLEDCFKELEMYHLIFI